jgi:hypothetical protein
VKFVTLLLRLSEAATLVTAAMDCCNSLEAVVVDGRKRIG